MYIVIALTKWEETELFVVVVWLTMLKRKTTYLLCAFGFVYVFSMGSIKPLKAFH